MTEKQVTRINVEGTPKIHAPISTPHKERCKPIFDAYDKWLALPKAERKIILEKDLLIDFFIIF